MLDFSIMFHESILELSKHRMKEPQRNQDTTQVNCENRDESRDGAM